MVVHNGFSLESPDARVQDGVDKLVLGNKVLVFQIGSRHKARIIDLVEPLGSKLDASGFPPM